MRHDELFGLNNLAAVDEQIQIQSARTPMNLTLPTVFILDTAENSQQLLRSQLGLDTDDSIQEVRLLQVSCGRRFIH